MKKDDKMQYLQRKDGKHTTLYNRHSAPVLGINPRLFRNKFFDILGPNNQ